jgi:hypothetical protein
MLNSMIKDKSITELIKLLKSKLEIEFKVVDHWDADLFAIGIQYENKMVYISTDVDSIRKQKTYDIDFEILSDKIEDYFVIFKGRRIEESEMVHDVRRFLLEPLKFKKIP